MLLDDKMIKDIFIREDIESTGIGEGIALPHARTDAVSKPLIAVAISKKGIEFDSLDSRPVKIIFMIVVPIKESKQLLKLLAKVTQFLKKPNSKQDSEILKDKPTTCSCTADPITSSVSWQVWAMSYLQTKLRIYLCCLMVYLKKDLGQLFLKLAP